MRVFSCAFHSFLGFPALFIGIKYTAPFANYLFSRTFHRYQVYRAFRQLLVFPRFSSVSSIPRQSPTTCFPALFIGIKYTAPVANYLFSRAFHRYQVYRACRQLLVSCAFHWYPVSRTFQRLHIFPRFWVTGVISQLFGSYQPLFLTFPCSESP